MNKAKHMMNEREVWVSNSELADKESSKNQKMCEKLCNRSLAFLVYLPAPCHGILSVTPQPLQGAS